MKLQYIIRFSSLLLNHTTSTASTAFAQSVPECISPLLLVPFRRSKATALLHPTSCIAIDIISSAFLIV